tara:strand:+ start:337 stop:570 length:234 start_codon:yes stop_codon:yes gene_type:complete
MVMTRAQISNLFTLEDDPTDPDYVYHSASDDDEPLEYDSNYESSDDDDNINKDDDMEFNTSFQKPHYKNFNKFNECY